MDWVFLELRDPSVPSTILYTCSALLQADGDIVAVDGVSPIVFANALAGNYYIGVRHRNHLAIVSAATIDLSTMTTIDFRDKTTNASASKMNELDNLKVMRAGDLNSNGIISAPDVLKVRQANVSGQTPTYKIEDANMNGQVTANDVLMTRRNNKPN